MKKIQKWMCVRSACEITTTPQPARENGKDSMSDKQLREEIKKISNKVWQIDLHTNTTQLDLIESEIESAIEALLHTHEQEVKKGEWKTLLKQVDCLGIEGQSVEFYNGYDSAILAVLRLLSDKLYPKKAISQQNDKTEGEM